MDNIINVGDFVRVRTSAGFYYAGEVCQVGIESFWIVDVKTQNKVFVFFDTLDSLELISKQKAQKVLY